MAVAKMRSEPARKRAVSRSSWAKDLTTRTPTTFSSAWVVTSATFCWTSFSTGWLVDRRTQHQRAGLVAVVEAEGEPLQMGVHRVGQVVLDRQRDAPGQEA